MEQTSEKLLTDLGFEHNFTDKYAEIYSHSKKGIIACVLTADYVPIKSFRGLFTRLSDIIKSGSYRRFIFDKRALRTFHQPSMEWYYIEWKTEMLNHGLTEHRKILPDLDWFVKAVEIAKLPLLDKIDPKITAQLDISYCDSFEEAVGLIARNN